MASERIVCFDYKDQTAQPFSVLSSEISIANDFFEGGKGDAARVMTETGSYVSYKFKLNEREGHA